LHLGAEHLKCLVDVAQGVAKILFALYAYFKPKSATAITPNA